MTFNGAKCRRPSTDKGLDGEQEAQVMAMRLGPPPQGYANWSLCLLACKVVDISLVESVSHGTVLCFPYLLAVRSKVVCQDDWPL